MGANFPGGIENIGKLLGDPPGVFAPAAIIVVAAAHPIHRRRVQNVAPLVEAAFRRRRRPWRFRCGDGIHRARCAVPFRPAAIFVDGLNGRGYAAVKRGGRPALPRPRRYHRDGLSRRPQINLAAPKIVVVRVRRGSCSSRTDRIPPLAGLESRAGRPRNSPSAICPSPPPPTPAGCPE